MVAGEDLGFRGGIWAWLGLGLSWGGFEAFVEDLGFRGAFVNQPCKASSAAQCRRL